MKGVTYTMATFKLSDPPALTGESARDISSLHAYVCDLYSQTRYVLGAIDEENLTDGIKNKLNIKEES